MLVGGGVAACGMPRSAARGHRLVTPLRSAQYRSEIVPRPTRVWIAEIVCSDRVAHKIRTKHGVDVHQVREAVQFYGYRDARWHVHPERGERLIVRGKDFTGKSLIVLLKPLDLDDGTFRLVTAREGE